MFRVDDSSSSGSLLTIILCTVTVALIGLVYRMLWKTPDN
jgi:hypothetical protein